MASPVPVSPPVLAPAANTPSGQSAPPLTPSISSTQAVPTTTSLPPPRTSLASKEWIVPPRPKPGRKAATDAPPTKRKAQNRAAQRAFRERRAARVGELEEELKKIEVEDEEEQNALRAQIERLQKEVEEYHTSLNFWMQKCRALEAEVAVESAAKEEALQSAKQPLSVPALGTSSAEDLAQGEALHEAEAIGCGNCSSISDCRCIQEVINMQSSDSSPDVVELSSKKRPHLSPHSQSIAKRIKPEPLKDLETDFTTSFANQPSNTTRAAQDLPTSSAVTDPCGFCTDGTPCICAEMQAAEAQNSNISNHFNSHQNHDHDQSHNHQRPDLQPGQSQTSSLLPRISQLSHITPPPSDTDVFLSTRLHPLPSSTTADPCINGPGTCLQCRSDPNSTLFCKSLARSQTQQQQQQQQTTSSSTTTTSILPAQQQSGCCRTATSSSGGGSCCQAPSQTHSTPSSDRNRPPATTTTTTTQGSNKNTQNPHHPREQAERDQNPAARAEESHIAPITLSCADAYTTLSRHSGYSKATREMERWLPQLRPVSQHAAPTVKRAQQDNRDDLAGTVENLNSMPEGLVGSHVDSNDFNMEGRPAMEIDAANVMAVLAEFDRRFA